MALAPFHLLAGVVAALLAAHPGGLDALAVHDPGARLRVPSEPDSSPPTQGRVQPLPRPVDAPGSEVVVVDGLPRREVVREQAPGAAAAHHVEDGVEDLAQRMEPGTAGCSGNR